MQGTRDISRWTRTGAGTKEFGIEYDEGAEGIDEPLTELNGDGKKFTLRLTDAPADSERSLLLKTLQRRHAHCPPAVDTLQQPPTSTRLQRVQDAE